MTDGPVTLFGDVATTTRAAAATTNDIAVTADKTSARTTGVAVDDTAATPKFVEGISPKRELPITWRTTGDSLVNKIVITFPTTLLFSQSLSWVLAPILMLGDLYLCFEDIEKIWGEIKRRISPE